MATTTNYGWTTPDDTALVKDGAAAIRTLGSSVDTTTKNLNPSTTLGDIEYRSSTANTNTRLGIGSTGNVLTVAGGVPTWAAPASSGPTFVGVSVYGSGTVSIANTTATNISWTGERFDTDGFHDNSTNNTRLTVPAGKAGKYLVIGYIAFDPGTGQRYFEIEKNGSLVNNIGFAPYPSGIAGEGAGTISIIIDLAVNDYIEFQVYQASGGNLNAYTGITFGTFAMTYLGA